MSVLLDRLRAALSDDYEVVRELASGGMGIVYLAHDRNLDRKVAIKVVDPSLATATATERFLREARTLASLSHPGIVPVHRAGLADGLPYYVMEYLDMPTLNDRLATGPLGEKETLHLADDLLGALEVVHARGLVHRDIKPSNIFVSHDGRAILTDFGIAKSVSADVSGLTAPGHMIGTPGYMPPEQAAGGEVGPRADLCAAGMVLYEAFTGRRWSFDEGTDSADWSGVPARLVPVLRRAVSWRARERWATASDFRRALAGGRPRLRPGLLPAALIGVAAIGILVVRSLPGAAAGTTILLNPLTGSGAASQFADSVTALLPGRTGANPDWRLLTGSGDGAHDVAFTLQGTVVTRAESASVEIVRPGGGLVLHWEGLQSEWSDAADSLASQLVFAVWAATGGAPLIGDLPVAAAPASARGRTRFIAAERHYARGEWLAADSAYQQARDLDSSCALCDFRRFDIARWARTNADSAMVRRFTTDSARFSEPYRYLIRAARQPLPERLETLREATTRWPRFHLGHMWRGDELYHRGPLAGHARSEALPHFEEARRLRPDFAPGLEHLAATAIGAGNGNLAANALDQYLQAGLRDMVSLELALLDMVGSVWRFMPGSMAAAYTRDSILVHPMLQGAKDLAAGPAYLLSFDVPAGVVFLGEQFVRGIPRPGLEVAGTLAMVHGLIALGRPDSALRLARQLGQTGEQDLRTWLAQLPAALALADTAPLTPRWRELAGPLERLAADPSTLASYRRRAQWMLALLAARDGRTSEALRLGRALAADSQAAAFSTLLEAASAPPAQQLSRSFELLAWDSSSSARTGDPFLRAMVRLHRARWALADGDTGLAVRELLWFENSDYVGVSISHVQSAEIDWALGTQARWQRATLLAGGSGDARLCADLAAVVRLWSDGEELYRRRAVAAGRTAARLACPA